MNRTQIAEWILFLAMPADRAAAVVGDLAESIEERGRVWFWFCVFRLTTAKIWQEISDSPFLMAGVLTRACVLNLALYVGLVLSSRLLITLIAFRTPMVWDGSGAMGFWIAALFAVSFFTGRWIAQRTPNREIAACILMCAALPVFSNLVGFALVQAWGTGLQRYADQASAIAFREALIWLAVSAGIVAGGLRIRSRFLRSTAQ